MKRLLALALYFSLILAPMAALMASEFEKIPDVLYLYGNRPFPFWVAAHKALTPSGILDSAILSPDARYSLTQYLTRQPKGDCIHLADEGETQVGTGPDLRPDLASAVRNTGWVFTARVTARASGFNGPIPGTLLQVVPEEVFKGPDDRLGEHYIFMPAGMVQLGNVKFCKTNPHYPDLPEVGEHVLLLISLDYVNRGKLLVTGNETGIVTIHDDGRVSLPKTYRHSNKALALGTREDLLLFVERTIHKGAKSTVVPRSSSTSMVTVSASQT